MLILSVGYTMASTWEIFHGKPKSCYVHKQVLEILSEINLTDAADINLNGKLFVIIEKYSGIGKDGSSSALLLFRFWTTGCFCLTQSLDIYKNVH